ncbi:hypothetical protein C8R46DRAFT_1219851 [Mycena filopes]|nr:hypothetical protein C8R46DRAFT_1219851 [Mycena filopes]
MSRWTDQHPNQGRPNLDGLVQYYAPRLPSTADVGLRRAIAFGLEHQNDPNPNDRFDEFVDAIEDVYIDHSRRPIMAGQAYDVSNYNTTYGVSAPVIPFTESMAPRKRAIDGRLAEIDPYYLYTSIPLPRKGAPRSEQVNQLGACCEFVTLQPYFRKTEGRLRTVRAVAREIERKLDREFCSNCKALATNAVKEFDGLRIIDMVSGMVYQSKQTEKAFKAHEAHKQLAQQQLAAQQQHAAQGAHLARQMAHMSMAPQPAPVVQYYQGTANAALGHMPPVAGGSNANPRDKTHKKKPKNGKTSTRIF